MTVPPASQLSLKSLSYRDRRARLMLATVGVTVTVTAGPMIVSAPASRVWWLS